MPGDRLEEAITHMRDFVDRYSKNRFVVSCRTAFYKDYFSRFRDVLLADFDDGQIADFVRNWFRSDQDRQYDIAEEFLNLLSDPDNASAKELASTPLLLTFLCLTYDDRQRLPPNRSELYRQALDILIERWAASKRVHNEPIYRELHARLEVQMLAEIAAPAFHENRYFFTRRELIDRITGFLRDELNAPKHLDGDHVLNAIEIQQGIIVQRAQEAWSFSHLTIQEYLTATWLESNQRIDEAIDKHLFSVRWREVFMLLAGVVGKADNLLERMLRVAEKQLTNAPQAIQFLRWANRRVVPTEDSEQAAARRALALAIARERPLGRDLPLELDRAKSLASTSVLNLSLTLDLARTPDVDLGLEFDFGIDLFGLYVESLLGLLLELDTSQLISGAWHEVSNQIGVVREQVGEDASYEEIIKAWDQLPDIYANALQLPPELRPSEKNKAPLNRYLYACQLIVDCKNAATRVSRPVWDDICQRMLNPPERSSSGGSRQGQRRKEIRS